MNSENASPELPPQIAVAIVAAMRAVSGVGKRGQNTEQNFKYRKYDDILSVAHDALVEAGLAIVPDVAEMKQRQREVTTNKGFTRVVTTTVVKVDYLLIAAADGSQVRFTFYGEASDYGDKSLGKALSYADKMMLIGLLKIPVDSGDLDPDQHSHADDTPVARPQPQRSPQVREPKRRSEAARAAAERPKVADAPARPAPPAESDDALHADVIERLTAINEDPEAEGGQAALERVWADVERGRLEHNAWTVEDYNTIKAHVREISARVQAALTARGTAAAAQMSASRPDPGEVDPWSDDPHEAAAARTAIDVAEGRAPMAFAGPGNQSGAADAPAA